MRTTAMRLTKPILSAFMLILLCASFTYAQEWTELLPNKEKAELTLKDYQEAFNAYWDPFEVDGGFYLDGNNNKVKARGWKQFKRWEWYWEPRVDANTGAFPSMTSTQAYERWLQLNGSVQRGPTANWTLMGPTASDGGYAGIGRINCIGFHPSDNNTFWVGAASGGLWQTTDGGSNWTILTDHLDVLAVSDIIINPDFAVSGTMYIATGDKDHWDNRSIGVLKSTDGGTTWVATDLSYTVSQGKMVNRLLMDPNDSDVIIAATTDGVYKTTDGGTNWGTQLTTTNFIDMEYKPGDFNTFYGCRSSGGEVHVSTDAGASWTNTLNTAGKRVELAITPAAPATVYALICASNNGLHGIYKSTDSGSSFTQTFDGTIAGNNLLGWSTDGSDSGGQGWYDLSMAASPSNANTVFVGGVNTWGSIDGGSTWSLVNHWYGGGGAPEVHADKHWLVYRSNGDLFECNDGGVYISMDDGASWTDKTNTMAISQIYRLGVSQTVPTEVQIGLQDNGTKLVTGGVWDDVRGGDGMECLIDYTNVNTQYNTYVNGAIRRTDNHWVSSVNIQPPGSSGAWVTPYIIDPVDPNTLYAGFEDIYKTTDKGASWTTLWDANSGGRFRAMAIAPSNTQYIYVSDPGNIWRTTDGGASWTSIENNLPGSFITYIAVKHDDPNTIWVTQSTYSGSAVHESTDGGATWTSISTGLPSIPANSIVQNKQVTGQVDLYVATDVGVYYKEGSADWVAFNDGLPNVDVQELEFYYDDNDNSNSRLRAASYGRGLWETELVPEIVADPCTELFFSEYIEGSGFNKCLEIYNPTGTAIDLGAGNYSIVLYSNGSSTPTSTQLLTGTIDPYGVYVVCNAGADQEFLDEADLTSGTINHNGDDAYELQKNGEVIDAFGRVGEDPGSEWTGGGCGTANETLVRNANIQNGDTDSSDPFDPSVEWTCYPSNTSEYLGTHTSDCYVEPETCVELFLSEYIEGSGSNKCLEIYNPTGTAVDLGTGLYSIVLYSNGSSTPTSTQMLSGIVDAYGVYVICNANADLVFLAEADATSGTINHNGDDAYELQKDGEVIDAFGQVGFDPGSSWTGGGCSTANNTLTRNIEVMAGDTDSSDPFDPSLEWTCQGNNVSTFLGSHVSNCYIPPCEITLETAAVQDCDDNGTPSLPDDDWFSMGFLANVQYGGTQFEVVLDANMDGTGGTVLATENYGTLVEVGTAMNPPFVADGMTTYTITIRDADDNSCFVTYTSEPVESCSYLDDCESGIEATIGFEYGYAFDLQTGTELGEGDVLSPPCEEFMESDFYFAYNSLTMPHAYLFPCAYNGVLVAAPELTYCEIDCAAVETMIFSPVPINEPFSVAVILTPDGKYWKLEFISEDDFEGVTFKYKEIICAEITNEDGPTISDPCACATFPDFDEEVVVTSPAGWAWTVSSNTGYNDPNTGLPFAISTPLQVDPMDPTKYTLVGQHVDDVGYSLTVVGGPIGQTPVNFLSISNECWYPDPSIDNLPATICGNAQAISLTGSAQLGDGSGPANMESESWFGNGVTGNSFDPSGLMPGPNNITYTFNAVDDDPDEHHPGCEASVTASIEVLEFPQAPIVSNIEACEGESTEITPESADMSSNPFNFYADAGLTMLLAGPVMSWDPGTTPATSPESYWVTEINTTTGCESSASMLTVTVFEVPEAPIVDDLDVCEGGSTLIVPEAGGGSTPTCGQTGDVAVTGVMDGTLSGGVPKFVELYVYADTDLTGWSVRHHNNGNPAVTGQTDLSGLGTITAGEFIYVINNGSDDDFMTWFGLTQTEFDALNTALGSVNINGDDAISLFDGTSIIDSYGEIGTDGTGTNWEYLDGWAYRNNETGPSGASFVEAEWTFSGINALDGAMDNGSTNSPFPDASYICTLSADPILFNFYDDQGLMVLLAGGVTSYDPGTTVATSPQSVWVTAVNSDGCESEAVEVVITVHELPTADAGPNQAFCGLPAGQVSINANANYSGLWSTNGSGFIGDAMNPNTYYSPNPADEGTTVIMTWTTEHSVCPNATDEMGILIVPETEDAEFSYALDEYCPGSNNPVPLHTTGVDGFYSWSLVSDGPDLVWMNYPGDYFSYDGIINLIATDPGTYEITNTVVGNGNMLITGVIDGPLSGGVPKAIEFVALADIPDLSIYGVSSVNNGGPSTGTPEYTFPEGSSATAGQHIWLATNTTSFNEFFGFDPTYTDFQAPGINGDDALELYCNGQIIDVFGVVGVNGDYEPWDYSDGWAYRYSNTQMDGEVFELEDWYFSGRDALDGETENALASTPFPIQTFTSNLGGLCTDNTHTEEVILGDLVDPEITCPDDQTIVLGEGECYTTVFWELPVVSDNCPGDLTLVRTDGGPLSGHYFYLDQSPYTITYEVTDANGNGPVECSFTIEILGYPDPVGAMVCNDQVQLSLDNDCALTLHPDMFLEGGPYQCYNYFEIHVEGYEYLGNVNNLSVEYEPGTYMVTIFDAAETQNNCMTLMIVEDKIAPTISCEPFDFRCTENYLKDGNGHPHPNFSGYPVVDDNCDNLDVTYSDEFVENGCGADYHATIYRTWRVLDLNNGKTDECVQEINIDRANMGDLVYPFNFDGLPNNLPMLECGTNFPLNANGNPDPSYTGYPFIGDDCTTFEMFYHDRNYTSDCGPKILRDWLVIDDCTGEIDYHTQIIRITDTQAPTFDVGEDIVAYTKGYICDTDIPVPDIMHLEDVCDIAPKWWVTVSDGYITGDYNQNGYVDFDENWTLRHVPLGSAELCYYAIDNCGNEYSQCIDIEVIDNVPPIPVCEQFKQVSLTPDGTAIVHAEDFDSGSYDNCGPVWFKVLRGFEYNSNNELVYDGGCQDLNGDDSPASGNQVWFDDEVGFCCEDLGNNVMVTLRVFEVDPGPGPVNPFDMYNPNGRLYGKYNDCWSVVEIECKIPPLVIAENVEVSCEENLDPYQNPDLYPSVTSVCDYEISYEDSDKIGDVCGGRIQRTWTVVSCDKTSSVVQNIYLTEAEPFDPCTISFPADETDITCPNDTGDPGYPTWEENPCNIVTAEIVNIDTFTFVDDACYKIVVDWAVIDWCVYEPNTGAEDNVDEVRNRRLVCNELVVDGYYRYTQILMVNDVYAPEIIVEDACVGINNGCFAENVVIEASATDTCNVAQEFWWKYVVVSMDTWDTIQYSYNFTPVPSEGRQGSKSKDKLNQTQNARISVLDPLPIGNYKITWVVGDGCGNANTATQFLTVADKKPPTPFMVDISTALMEECMVEVCAILFDKGACDGDCLASYDNCSEILYFTFTDILPIIEHPEWIDEHGLYYFNPQTGEQYTASAGRARYLLGEAHSWDPEKNTACRVYVYDNVVPPPFELVTIFVWDQFALNEDCDDGNYDFTEVYLTLENSLTNCLIDGALVMGGTVSHVKSDEAIDDVMITVDANSPEYPRHKLTHDGSYSFAGLTEGSYEVSGEKNDDYGNGVSTLDLVLIQKHLLGITQLDNAYDLIAADANLNGSISGADLFEFRKLILGVQDDLSGGKSWRFIDDSYAFVNPLNPWNEMAYAEIRDVEMIQDVDNINFLGIKLGDINGSAKANANSQQLESRIDNTIELTVDEESYESGVLEVAVVASNFVDVAGMQFTMDLGDLHYIGIEAGGIKVSENNIGLIEDGLITMSWNVVNNLSVEDGTVLFTLKLSASGNGLLSRQLVMNSDITSAEIYTGQALNINNMSLTFNGVTLEEFTLYQNEPNPFSEFTSIGFNLPAEEDYVLSIYDITGKLVKEIQDSGIKGYNSVRIESKELPSGVLYYQLSAGDESATMKMILIQ